MCGVRRWAFLRGGVRGRLLRGVRGPHPHLGDACEELRGRLPFGGCAEVAARG